MTPTVSCSYSSIQVKADETDPPWVIEHSLKSQLADMRAASEGRRERLAAARERERKARRVGSGSMGAFRVNGKRAKIASTSSPLSGNRSDGVDKGDDHFLPNDTAAQAAAEEQGEGVFLSKEVRDLMAK